MTTFAPISTSSGSSTPSPSSSPGARSDRWSTRTPVERLLEALQHAHYAQPAASIGHRGLAVAHAVSEVAALDPQRLFVRHTRAPDVTGARDVLAKRAVVLVEALVVDDQLLLELHVVEGRHLVRTDDGEAALLVRVEPGQVQVRHEPR